MPRTEIHALAGATITIDYHEPKPEPTTEDFLAARKITDTALSYEGRFQYACASQAFDYVLAHMDEKYKERVADLMITYLEGLENE